MRTKRQRMRRILKFRESVKASTLAAEITKEDEYLTVQEVIDELRELGKSLDESETLMVAGPICKECKFDKFDNPANMPSQCPECRSEWIAEPRFTIE